MSLSCFQICFIGFRRLNYSGPLLYNLRKDLANICKLLQYLLKQNNYTMKIQPLWINILIEGSLESEIKFQRLPALSWRMYSGIITETVNVITTSSCPPFIRKTPDVCVLDTAGKLKPPNNTIYFRQSHRTNSCHTVLWVSLKTSIIYTRNSRHYHSGKKLRNVKWGLGNIIRLFHRKQIS